jgi:hypothetical protein
MTLATSTMFARLNSLVTHGQPVIGLAPQLLWMGSGSLGPFAISVLLMITVVTVMQVLLNRTLFGLRVRPVGGNIEAARLTGVNVRGCGSACCDQRHAFRAGRADRAGADRQRRSHHRRHAALSDHHGVDPGRHAVAAARAR